MLLDVCPVSLTVVRPHCRERSSDSRGLRLCAGGTGLGRRGVRPNGGCCGSGAIALFAGAAAVRSALEANVVDELRMIRYPILLGAGKPLFDGQGARRRLSLIETRAFSSGAVLSRYAVSGAA